MINEDVEIRMQCHYHIRNLPLFSEGDLSNRYIFLCLQEKREIKDAGHGISTIHATQEKMEPLAVPPPPPPGPRGCFRALAGSKVHIRSRPKAGPASRA